jgi:hypothetical protein
MKLIGYPSFQAAYIHIPKTGGTYLRQYESNQEPVVWPIEELGHVCVVDRKRKGPSVFPLKVGVVETVALADIRRFFIFSTVRNIFEWLVSYAGHAGGWSSKYLDTNHYDYENAQKGFDYLVKTIANRDDIWPCRKFIFFQLFCDNGELIVDWLNRTETLDEDLEALAEYLRINYRKGSRQRVGEHQDYRSYYNDSLIELVYQTWGRELRLFGYNFEGFDITSAILKRKIDKRIKKMVTYDWATDSLVVQNQLVTNNNIHKLNSLIIK